jgi:hypothetical protein
VEPLVGTTVPISTSKAAVTVPARVLVNGADATTNWNVCVYKNAGSGALVAQPSTYSVAPTLDVSSAAMPVASGPAKGGTKVTVNTLANSLAGLPVGVDVGNALTATLGGVALTGIRVVDANSFTGYTGMHAPGQVDLNVTTAAGTATKATLFTYSYGINVTPNTAPNTRNNVVLDVTGAGFMKAGKTWATSATDLSTTFALPGGKARVLLTDNNWYQTNSYFSSAAPAFSDTAMPITQCGNVLVISDTELICTMDLTTTIFPTLGTTSDLNKVKMVASSPVPVGVYNITVIDTDTALQDTSYNYSIPTSGSTFTVSSY